VTATGTDLNETVIVGSGPAGYTAALYTARANLAPVVVEGDLWGGLLQETTDVENFPGFPGGVLGPELMLGMREQAEHFGARLITAQATDLHLATTPGGIHKIIVDGGEVLAAKTVIIATGAAHKKLSVTGEQELSGRGVSYCATCDAAFFRGHETIVVGGGDSAMEEAIFLARFAATVTIVNRRPDFRASKIMLARAKAQDNIRWATPYVVEQFAAGDDGALSEVILAEVSTGERRAIPATGAFVAVGHEPQSVLLRGQIDLDQAGYVKTVDRSTRTNLPGVFAAGDVVDHTYRQAITAAGAGCQAALDASWYLRDTPEVAHPAALPEGNLAEAQWSPSRAPATFAGLGEHS
jgi:thioredoxin reductase (NADPH)